jgi:hypothetical protein
MSHYDQYRAATDNKEDWEMEIEQNDAPLTNKYQKRLRNNIAIDVYDVLDAFSVENPALQHAIKKMLCAGQRGYKDYEQDIEEAIASLQRAKDFPPIPF